MVKSLRFSLVGLLLMLAGGLFAQTEVTFDATVDKSEIEGQAEDVSVSKSGVTVRINGGTGQYGSGVMSNGTDYRCYKSATLTVTSASGNIKKIVFNCTANGTTKYGPGCFTTTTPTYTYDGKVGTWQGDASSVAFTASSNQVRMTSIVVTVGESDPNAVAAPVISGTSPFSGETTCTITAGEGCEIRYTVDGTDPTAASALYTAPFAIRQNTTVKAIAVKGGKTSKVAEKVFETAALTDATIASLNGQSEDIDYVKLAFNNAVVTYVDGKNIYLREGGLCIVLCNSSLKLVQGNVLNGYISGAYDNYYGVPEFKENDLTSADNLTVGAELVTVMPTEATVDEILGLNYVADYVLLEGVTITSEESGKYTNYYAVSGGSRVQLFKGIDVSGYAGDGKTYYVTALFNNIYKSAAELQPVSVSVNKPTAIKAAAADVKAGEGALFNLNGQRLSQPVKGLNIRNGKKFIVK